MGSADSVIFYQEIARELFEKIRDTLWIGIANNYLGTNYMKTGNFPLALKRFQRSLDVFKLLGNNINVGANLNAMGIIYRKMEEKEKEEQAYLEAIQYLEQEPKSKYLGEACNNLAEIYFDKGETSKAFETLEKAKEVYEAIGHKIGLCSYYSVIGYYYSTLTPPDYEKVIEYFTKSTKIALEEKDLRQYADGTSFLGKAYLEMNRPQQARNILLKGFKAAEENNLKPELLKITDVLSEVYYRLNQPREAYKLLRRYTGLKESLAGEEQVRKITQLDLQYKFRNQQIQDSMETARREMEKELKHKKELQARERAMIIFLFVALVVVIVAIFLFVISRRRKQRLRATQGKNRQIEKQKNEIERIASDLDHKNKELQKLNEFKDSMTGMLVHDLKNPLIS